MWLGGQEKCFVNELVSSKLALVRNIWQRLKDGLDRGNSGRGAIFTKKNRGLREVDLLTGSVSIIKRETIEQNGK